MPSQLDLVISDMINVKKVTIKTSSGSQRDHLRKPRMLKNSGDSSDFTKRAQKLQPRDQTRASQRTLNASKSQG